MKEHYKLRTHAIGEGCECKTLVSAGNKDFLDDWAHDYRKHDALIGLIDVMIKISQRGTAEMVKTSRLSPIKHENHLFEIKHFSGNKRVMAHIENDIVLLLPYTAHKGGNANNNMRMMKRVKRLNEIASQLIADERRGADE